MKNSGFKISQYACAVLLITSSIALVTYQVVEIIEREQSQTCLSYVEREQARCAASRIEELKN